MNRKLKKFLMTALVFCLVLPLGAVTVSAGKKKDKIRFNEIESRASLIKYCWEANETKEEDAKELTRKEITEHFGSNIFPEVPKDLSEEGEKGGDADRTFRIFVKDGKVYQDKTEIYYSDHPNDYNLKNRTVGITVKTGEIPNPGYELHSIKVKTSKIAGTKLIILRDKKEKMQYAEFMKGNVGFRISTRNLKKKEFMKVLSSVLKK